MRREPNGLSDSSTMREPRRSTGTAMALVCSSVMFLGISASALVISGRVATASAAGACPNEAIRIEQHAAELPNCRAYELVSPSRNGKIGLDVMPASSHTQAAVAEAPGLPMAVGFASLGAFGDAVGTGIAAEYLAQRDAEPGTSGWHSHAITPPQEPLSISAAVGYQPRYMGDKSADLTSGVFRAWSPLSPEPNIQNVTNFYTRTDLRTPGDGSYQLLTDSATLQPPLNRFPGSDPAPVPVGESSDFSHVLYEYRRSLTSDVQGRRNYKLYKADDGISRFVTNGSPVCPGGNEPAAPCSLGGIGGQAGFLAWNVRLISADGSRVAFSTPLTETGLHNEQLGKLYELDDGGTSDRTDDTVIQINSSERAAPEPTRAAEYQIASVDHSRVFFVSREALTDDAEAAGEKLYLWSQAPQDEEQQLSVDASSGTFTLIAHTQPSHGAGDLTAGSDEVSAVAGAFSVGQSITGPGIPAGTTIVDMGSFSDESASTLRLSQLATATTATAPLEASMAAETAPLPFDASASEIQAALTALHFPAPFQSLPLLGEANVQVNAVAAQTYGISFTGALAGVNVMPLTADSSGLSGGTASAAVTTTNPVHNLRLVSPIKLVPAGFRIGGVMGSSLDGTRTYFATQGEQLVPGAPPIPAGASGIYLWQDANGIEELSFVGATSGNMERNVVGHDWLGRPPSSRVSPDGRVLVFGTTDGFDLPPGYAHADCQSHGSKCVELYLYDSQSSTATEPAVICVSCDMTTPEAGGTEGVFTEGNAFLDNVEVGTGVFGLDKHFSHALSDDGRFVFFTTFVPLVPEDTNGRFDAYEFDTESGTAHLLSSGTNNADSYFMDASADGSDAVIATRQRLLAWDTDSSADLYDVRVDGGFPEPPAPPTAPCEGETCRQASPPTPAAIAVGSTQEGSGNRPSRPRCPKGRRPVRRGGKLRCAHKHKKHHQRRTTSDNRRHGR